MPRSTLLPSQTRPRTLAHMVRGLPALPQVFYTEGRNLCFIDESMRPELKLLRASQEERCIGGGGGEVRWKEMRKDCGWYINEKGNIGAGKAQGAGNSPA